MAEAAVAEGQGQQNQGSMFRFFMQMVMVSMVMNFLTSQRKQPEQAPPGKVDAGGGIKPGSPDVAHRQQGLRNLYGQIEECELLVHLAENSTAPPLAALRNETLANEQGWTLLWQQRVWYEASAAPVSSNITVSPLSAEVLNGSGPLHIHATMILATLLEDGKEVPREHLIRGSLPLVASLKELEADAGAVNLFAEEEQKPTNPAGSKKIPYFKTRIDIRPVVDHTVHSPQTVQQAPFKRLKLFRDLGIYQPMLYVSDFWLLEKDYLALNETLAGQPLNLSLSYYPASLWVWSLQAQMAEQWTTQSEWGVTDTQRDSFMLKRLMTDTNPYLLAFSGAFIMLHMVFSLLAFKNDIQFWRKNESMQGLSARSMVVSFVCQLITTLYLLDSQETSRLILVNIVLDTGLASWKLMKAVKVQLTPSFPFVSISGQKGYEENDTSKYDEEAIRYMVALLAPLFAGYFVRSLIYGKHRSFYSFFVGAAAGGVYTFGFAMMTPQLYINFKLKSVEHLPWRALTYKAMNTFVDDIAALLIDMPMMHRLSCFRDDIVFFVYVYQRWKYRVDKTRPTMWVAQEETPPASCTDAAGNPALSDSVGAPSGSKSACVSTGTGDECSAAAPQSTKCDVPDGK
mmetsp:Transcript_94977/g.188135  ORF Transcript_94977/g.188135 Transcript_94977/m.188135 type:complete len:627 (+) Transcript_94977:109-1989(+)